MKAYADDQCILWKIALQCGQSYWQRKLGLAQLEGDLAGFGKCGDQRSDKLLRQEYSGEISAIYVAQAFQRRGVGSALMRDMSSALSARSGWSLWVILENQGAPRFYKALGGELVGEQEDVRPGGVLREVAYGWKNVP